MKYAVLFLVSATLSLVACKARNFGDSNVLAEGATGDKFKVAECSNRELGGHLTAQLIYDKAKNQITQSPTENRQSMNLQLLAATRSGDSTVLHVSGKSSDGKVIQKIEINENGGLTFFNFDPNTFKTSMFNLPQGGGTTCKFSNLKLFIIQDDFNICGKLTARPDHEIREGGNHLSPTPGDVRFVTFEGEETFTRLFKLLPGNTLCFRADWARDIQNQTITSPQQIQPLDR